MSHSEKSDNELDAALLDRLFTAPNPYGWRPSTAGGMLKVIAAMRERTCCLAPRGWLPTLSANLTNCEARFWTPVHCDETGRPIDNKYPIEVSATADTLPRAVALAALAALDA